ncbi:MAG: thioredoxin family protein [Algicola sp.]|nr:thioredoxin family protein [Algicola sp.]
MTQIINESLEKAISYPEYRQLVRELVAQNTTTSFQKTEAYIGYTKLNDRRMKRWDKTVKIPDNFKERLSHFKRNMTWLVITESWCGDAAHLIPVLHKITELTDNIDLKLVFRDENERLMDQFLTNGAKAIAKVIMIDDATGEVVNTYGPRPSKATHLVDRYKAEHGTLTPEFKETLQVWYNKDKGQNVLSDMMDLLEL